MRKEQGLSLLTAEQRGQVSAKKLSKLLMDDLSEVSCKIYGKTAAEQPVLLAELNLVAASLYYEMFDQRIEFVVEGCILNDQYVPLTYQVQGQCYGFYGRCSVIRKVCGVDLYLSKAYTEKKGDKVRQRFFVSVKQLVKQLR